MAIPKKLDFSDYDNFITEPNYTTSAEAQDYFRNMDELLEALVDCGLWQPQTNYPNGYVVVSPNMPNGTEAVCVAKNGGVSSNVEPQWGSVGGGNVSDGTCFWHLRYRAVSVNNIEADNKGNITIPVMRASTNIASGADGLVPAPPATSNELFLSNDGEWKEAGKVKSVNGKTGDVVVDVGVTSVNNKTGAVTLKESPSDMTDYIIESYRNGTEWYEVYKSGKIRQGGVLPIASSGVWASEQTLLKPFADRNYTVFLQRMYDSTNDNAQFYAAIVRTKFTTKFGYNKYESSQTCFWYAEGQGA